MTLSSL